tara:strand:- start:2077 stop:2589 length:513 start_codon:yes stop_codon:yes gene_type:complete
MPTEKKAALIEDLKECIADCSIAIATDYAGISVSEMSELRTAIRNQGMKFKVVKNTLMKIAADESEWPELQELVDGPTGIVFGYGEEQEAAKLITKYIKDSGIELKLKSSAMGSQILSAKELQQWASLPGKDELIAQLIGQLHGQMAALVYTLNNPITRLARTLNTIATR